ncbi:MAG: hypothetical protein ISF22_05485 [Methanomassiliicoccus sp.]|nr:hypothetical protein [Methanomassiliicoccus sp.]
MNKDQYLCYSCLFSDKRPEAGVNEGLIYCQKKRLVVRPKSHCEVYVKATAQNRESYNASIYGTIAAGEFE